ncbi:MAG: lytic murein transglycosylase [Candidatus Nomurabacteria bacterium]
MKFANYSQRFFVLSFFILAFFVFTFSVKINTSFAQSADQNTRAQLQAQLDDLEKQIAAQQQVIATTQAQGASLSRDISLLQSQINTKKLQIKKISNNISSLSNQISDKNVQLDDLNSKLGRQKAALADALRKVNSFDGMNSFVNLVLNGKTLSDYFAEADKITALQNAINQNVTKVKNITDEVTQVKDSLQENKDSQVALKNQQTQEQNQISQAQSQKNDLLKQTKGQEAIYKKQLADKQTKAAQIRAALFNFAGGSTAAIQFGDALNYAKSAESVTGTPAAFVLAILTQESALGVNVGKCYLSDLTSGAGYNMKTNTTYSNVMKPGRDISPFISITSSYGMDPLKTVVSCPIPSAGGYGGAMGPAQFIPSTWQTVASRIRAATGSSNPWNARDSIMASSIYLSDLGANSTYLSQIRAACKYYGTGGSNCSYGNSVMSKMSKIQSNIDYINQYGR